MTKKHSTPKDTSDALPRQRQRRTIVFPYADLQKAVEVAQKINEKGGGTLSADQLAASLGRSSTSGPFRSLLSAASAFGLIKRDRREDIMHLTDLGRKIIDNITAPTAKVEAWKSIPLFKKIYEDNKGRNLPPLTGITEQIIRAGVPQKQANRARQVLMSSAKYADFYDAKNNRLVEPVSSSKPPVPLRETISIAMKSAGESKKLHPLIEGLIETLPNKGDPWSEINRKKWLETAENIFSLIYKMEEKDKTTNNKTGGNEGDS